MRFLFSIMTLASIAGALMVLYAGAGSVLKLNQSSDEDKALAAERAAGVIMRMAQRNGALAKMQINGNPAFDPQNVSSSSLPPALAQLAATQSVSEQSFSEQSVPEQPAPAQPELSNPWRTGPGSSPGDEPKRYAAAVPKLPVLQPSQWVEAASRIFAPAPPVPHVIPHRTPTPAEEALAVYRKYATPQ